MSSSSEEIRGLIVQQIKKEEVSRTERALLHYIDEDHNGDEGDKKDNLTNEFGRSGS